MFRDLMVKGPALCGIDPVLAERIGHAGGLMFDDEIADKESPFRRQDADKTDIEFRYLVYFTLLDLGINYGGDPKKIRGLKYLLMLGGAKTEEQSELIKQDDRYSTDNVETAVFAEAMGVEEGQEIDASQQSFWI